MYHLLFTSVFFFCFSSSLPTQPQPQKTQQQQQVPFTLLLSINSLILNNYMYDNYSMIFVLQEKVVGFDGEGKRERVG
jgi:hypothetical protein